MEPQAFEEGVRNAGFELLWVELEVRGTLGTLTDGDGQERPTISVATPEQRFVLFSGETEEERASYAALNDSLDQTERVFGVRGRPRERPAASVELTLSEFSSSP